MPMGIMNNYGYSGYKTVYTDIIKVKNNSTAAKPGISVPTDSVDKSSGENIVEYYSYLQGKYDCVKNGNVSISGSYLKECAANPEKALELEQNLSFYKQSYESGYKSAALNAEAHGAKLTNYSESWSIDKDGNISILTTTTISNEKSFKSMKETLKEVNKRAEEKHEKERLEAKRKEKKDAEKKWRKKV